MCPRLSGPLGKIRGRSSKAGKINFNAPQITTKIVHLC